MRKYIPGNARLIPGDAKLVFKGLIHDVYHWPQKMFDGSYTTFEMLRRPDTVKVIAIKDDKIVIEEQQQPNHDELFFDIPGGRHDEESEDELVAAKRELLEETGMTFGNWKLVDAFQPALNIDHLVYVFVATGFEKQEKQRLDNGEKINLKLMEFDDVKALVDDPRARYLPRRVLEKVGTIQDLKDLPNLY